MNSRKRSTWAWAVSAMAVGLLLYLLSFGPACWWFCKDRDAPRLYWPVGWIASRTYDGRVYQAIRWYATLRIDMVGVPAGLDEERVIVLVSEEMENIL